MHLKLRGATKLMLMPLLALWLVFSLDHPPILIVLGIICGFVGDLFLLAGKDDIRNFVLGSFCFAGGHVLYAVYFLKHLGGPVHPIPVIVAVLCYGSIILFFIKRLSKNMNKKLLVGLISYFSIIAFMSISAFLFMITNRGIAYCLPFAASLMFMLSDGFLSFDKFRKKIKYRHLIVMITYILAQSGITFGIYWTLL